MKTQAHRKPHYQPFLLVLWLWAVCLCVSNDAYAQNSPATDIVCFNRFSIKDSSLYVKAIDNYEKKKYTEASAALRKLSARYPKAPDPYFYLGLMAVARGDSPNTIRRYFTKLIQVCPNYPKALAHYWMGVIHYSDEHYAEAVESLQYYFDIANRQGDTKSIAVYEEASNYLYWSQFLADAYAHPVPFAPTLVRGASSAGNEMSPFITIDGQEIYYLRQMVRRNYNSFFQSIEEEQVTALMCSRWQDSVFSTGEELPAPFNQHDQEGGVSLTADNRTLVYSILQQGTKYNNYDIYTCQKRHGRWQAVENAGRNVNSETSWESQPSISADGQWLYFASNREGGHGGTDIWRCHRLPNGDWSRAENLGSRVNTPGDEKFPFLHADNHTLYFASNGWQGFGGYDVYFIDLNNTQVVRPTNMGLPINSEGDDICLAVTTDGSTAYFSGRQHIPTGDKSTPLWPAAGGTDIYHFPLYPEAQPEPMRHHTLTLVNRAGKPVTGTVRVLRQGQKPFVFHTATPATDSLHIGESGIVLSERETNIVVCEAEGCVPTIWSYTAGRGQSLPTRITLQTVEMDKRYNLPFRIASPMGEVEQQCLDVVASWLLQHPRMHIRIECAQGAEVAHKYLLSVGLRADRLTYRDNAAVPNLSFVVTQNE